MYIVSYINASFEGFNLNIVGFDKYKTLVYKIKVTEMFYKLFHIVGVK